MIGFCVIGRVFLVHNTLFTTGDAMRVCPVHACMPSELAAPGHRKSDATQTLSILSTRSILSALHRRLICTLAAAGSPTRHVSNAFTPRLVCMHTVHGVNLRCSGYYSITAAYGGGVLWMPPAAVETQSPHVHPPPPPPDAAVC